MMEFFKIYLLSTCYTIGIQSTEPVGGDTCSRFTYEYRILEELINLKQENARLAERLKAMETRQKTPVITAHVRLSQTTSLTGTQRVKYDEVVSNIGGAYDMEHGQFTVPVSGLYLIRVTVCLFANQWIDLNIVKNRSVIGRAFSGDEKYHNCGSESFVNHLEAGELVWVEETAGTASALNEDHGWNSFTVTLLSAD